MGRLLVHGRPKEIVLAAGPTGSLPTGIYDGPSPGRFIVERGTRFVPRVGQRLAFAESGERRIVRVEALPRYYVVTVNGPLDPVGDGSPHPLRLIGAE